MGDCVISKGIVIWPFNYAGQKWLSQNFDRTILRKIGQSFWSLKKDTRTFNFCSHEPSLDMLGPLDRYDHTSKQQKTTKNQQTRIRDLSSGKKY